MARGDAEGDDGEAGGVVEEVWVSGADIMTELSMAMVTIRVWSVSWKA